MMAGDKIKITGFKPDISDLRIEVPRKNGERFIKEILPSLRKLGEVEVYRKKQYSYYLNVKQANLLNRLCKVYIVGGKYYRK